MEDTMSNDAGIDSRCFQTKVSQKVSWRGERKP